MIEDEGRCQEWMNNFIDSHSGGFHSLYTTMTYKWSRCSKPVNCYKKGASLIFYISLHIALLWLSAFPAMHFTIYDLHVYMYICMCAIPASRIFDNWWITHLQVRQVVRVSTKIIMYILYLIMFGVKLGFGSVRLLSPNENTRVHFWIPNTSVVPF